MIRIAVCIPGESMPMESVRCYGAMMMRLLTQPPKGLAGVSQHMFASSMLPYSRASVIDRATKAGATHLFLLDSDMTYPPDTVHRLLAHGRPFVASNATTRRPPIRWVAKRDGKILDSNELTGLTKADHCGVAVALVETRVIESCERPLFNFTHSENGWRGEDIFFCERVRAAGFHPMIDHDLSKEVRHLGSYAYGAEDAEEPQL